MTPRKPRESGDAVADVEAPGAADQYAFQMGIKGADDDLSAFRERGLEGFGVERASQEGGSGGMRNVPRSTPNDACGESGRKHSWFGRGRGAS